MPDVDFGGETFRTADEVAFMAELQFAHVAKAGIDAGDLDGLAAMYELLEQCLHAEDWQRFKKTALRTKASGDDLLAFVGEVGRALRGQPATTEPEPAEKAAFELFPA